MENHSRCSCSCESHLMSTCSVKSTDLGKSLAGHLGLLIIDTRGSVRDWIHGIRAAAPSKETRASLEAEPLYEAERLRIIYQLITNPVSEGGAGITPKEGEWANVESIFALHDHAYNKDWIKKWSSQYLLQTEDLDDIRNRLGEKV